MIDLKEISEKSLMKLLHETDDMTVVEEVARRINLGLIPLAIVGFSELSNRKLKRLETLTLSDWATRELWQRERDGRIPAGKTVTIEELRKESRRRRANEAKA